MISLAGSLVGWLSRSSYITPYARSLHCWVHHLVIFASSHPYIGRARAVHKQATRQCQGLIPHDTANTNCISASGHWATIFSRIGGSDSLKPAGLLHPTEVFLTQFVGYTDRSNGHSLRQSGRKCALGFDNSKWAMWKVSSQRGLEDRQRGPRTLYSS